MSQVTTLIDIGKDLPGYALSVLLIIILWQGVKVLREEMRNNRDALKQAAILYTRNADEMSELRKEINNLKVTVEVGFERLPADIQAAITKSLTDQIAKRPAPNLLQRLFWERVA